MVQLHHFDPAAHRCFGKAGLLCDFLNGAAEVKHHLEALGLLIDRQIGTLHIFQKHCPNLFLLVHFRDNTGDFAQARQLCGGKTPVADHNGEGFVAVVSRHDGQVLENAVGLDTVRQLRQVPQVFPGVVRMGKELVHRELGHKLADLSRGFLCGLRFGGGLGLGDALGILHGDFTDRRLDNLHQPGSHHRPALLERSFSNWLNDGFVRFQELPELHRFLVGAEKRAFRYHGYQDAAGPQNAVRRENMVNVLLAGEWRVHHKAGPRRFDSQTPGSRCR